MSVLIKEIEMPKNCAECRFCVNGFTDEAPMYECACESYENVSVLVDDHGKPFNFRPDWCPLIEVPTPHGRLIDVDDFMRHLIINTADLRTLSTRTVGKALRDSPTIIEAEGSDT